MPRPYQQRLFDFVAASEGSRIKVQMPSRTGKTFCMATLTKKRSDGRPCLVVVNRVQLAEQHARTFEGHGLRVGRVGGGTSSRCDPAAVDVVVCVDRSIAKLERFTSGRGVAWDYKFLDEAHHYEADDAAGACCDTARSVRAVRARRTILFSATYADEEDVDFRYTLEEAVADGWVADYKFHVPVMIGGEGDRAASVAALVAKYHVSWSPMLVVFNSVAATGRFRRALPPGTLRSAVYTSETPKGERARMLAGIGSGAVDVLAVVGCLNEGTDIPALRTVVIAEPRNNPLNKRQLGARPMTPHPSKTHANVVLPLFYRRAASGDDDDSGDLDCAQTRTLLRAFFDADPRLVRAVRRARRDGGIRFRVSVEDGSDRPAEEAEEATDDRGELTEAGEAALKAREAAELVRVDVFDRLGRLVPMTDLQKAEAVGALGRMPKPKKMKGDEGYDRFDDGTGMYGWLVNLSQPEFAHRRTDAVLAAIGKSDEAARAWLDRKVEEKKKKKMTDADAPLRSGR